MRIDTIKIKNESQLLADYRNNTREIMQFFDYHPYDSFRERLNELQQRDFKRERLADVLEKVNRRWGASSKTLHNIDKLKNIDSVVVIGGQQAGLLTGPLYTVNKVISILQFAKQQEKELNIPVIPVFWIAGEDHDYDEINHVYLPYKTHLKKHKLKQSHFKKSSVSHVELDKDICRNWVDELFSQMGETNHTKGLYKMVLQALKQSDNFTDFFARIIFELFPNEGLVLIDSANDDLRSLESDYFIQLIENQRKISHGVYRASQELQDRGFSLTLDLEENDGHLFYHLDNERILLERTKNGNWIGKQEEIELTTEELIDIAKKSPEILSNNVVSRPLMQEMVFPTLSFIAGPGEIAYWAALKPAFHSMDMKMPPVLPRLSYTYISNRVIKALQLTGVELESAIVSGTTKERNEWIQNKQQPSIEELADSIKRTIEEAHDPLRKMAGQIRSDIHDLSKKNLYLLHQEIDFLKNRMNLAWEEKYKKDLEQYDILELYLHPEEGFQERKWNPLPFLNQNGIDIFSKVVDCPCSMKEQHYVVYL